MQSRSQLQNYYELIEEFLANASTTKLLMTGGIAIPLLGFLFGIPLFFLLAGIVIGIYVAFAAVNPWKDLDLEPLPWKKDGKTRAEMFNGEFKPLIHSTYTPSKPVEDVIQKAVDIIVTNYVESWYSSLAPDDTTFVDACRQTLLDTATAFSGQQALKRPADIFLVLLFSTCNTFVVFLRELRAVAASYSATIFGVHEYIAANPESALAQMIDLTIQRSRFRNAADNIVQTFLPVLDLKRSPIALLAREIIAKQVLEATVDTFSDPDEVNKYIIYLLQREGNIQELARNEINLQEANLSSQATEKLPEIQNHISIAADVTLNAPSTASLLQVKSILDRESCEVSGHELLQQPLVSEEEDGGDLASLAALSSVDDFDYDSLAEAMGDRDDYTVGMDDNQKTPTLQSRSRYVRRKPLRSSANISSSVATAPVSDDITNHESPTTFDQMFQDPEFTTSERSLSQVDSSSAILSPRKQSDLASVSLYQANISVIDSSADSSQSTKPLSSKPVGFYTLVIEPTGGTPGWMAMRNISDFERLHIVLQKLATLAGITTFPDIFPSWHGVTRSDYCQTLQLYLQLVASKRELADCEAMKKFVDKKETTSAVEKKWQKAPIFKHAGEGMMDAISRATSATASAKESRNAILNVLAAAKKQSVDTINRTKERQRQTFMNGPDFSGLAASVRQLANGGLVHSGAAQGGLITHDTSSHSLPGYNADLNSSSNSLASVPDSTSVSSTLAGDKYLSTFGPADGDSHDATSRKSLNLASISTPTLARSSSLRTGSSGMSRVDSTSSDVLVAEVALKSPMPEGREEQTRAAKDQENRRSAIIASHQPLSQNETNSLIDSMFLAISELYLLSNAWTVRRSLLTVLRGLFLRNGSSSVEGVRVAIQKDIIDKYSSEEELTRKLNDLVNSVWAEQPSTETSSKEKSDALANEARKMFISHAIPDAIKSVMGAGASAQALEYVFEVLQDRNIARGLVSNLLMDCVTTMLM
ncbi:PXA domain-containing protein [Lipomyces arxii]|uniref:PXA domain-containing protein n=1 Tax=Lipomyces arxii TaxID=56418 RepID=UPI0034CE81C8